MNGLTATDNINPPCPPVTGGEQGGATAGGIAGGAHAEHYDPVAGKIGMWLFLFTEIILFGAMFIAYAVYLSVYRWEFQETSGQLDKLLGAFNTVILLTSSLTMALSIAVLQRGKRLASLGLLLLTLAMAGSFLVVKSFEWGHKFEHGIYPRSDVMLQMPDGHQLFYGLYFTMTGIHALHVIIGALIILVAMVLIWKRKIRPDRIVFLENTGLYWHLVDAIWIYLFPLFYLVG